MKRCLIFFTFFLVAISVHAQGLYGGLHIGGNVSQVDGDFYAGFSQVGLSLGGFVLYNISDPMDFQVEFLFEQLGSARQGVLILRTNQISLPILLRYKLPITLSDGNHTLDVQAGLSPGYLFSAKSEFNDVTDQLDRYDLRAIAGVEYRFSDRGSVLMRYGYSVISFLNTSPSLASNLLGPGKVGLAHHYLTLAYRVWLTGR
ncbi:MAG: PorT family protein [Bacteroidia bacterium]|nr:PorT family protein [Bacteroidia bacterium]